jgi:hypothetical protein
MLEIFKLCACVIKTSALAETVKRFLEGARSIHIAPDILEDISREVK